MTPTDTFSFTLYDENIENTRKLELQPVELVLNGATQLVGRIDVTERGDNGRTIVCRGRDFMADLIECNVDPTIKITSGETLLNAIAKAASPVGIDSIWDDDGAMRDLRAGRKVKARKPRKKHASKKLNDYKPQPGQGIYEFLNKIMAREGVTLQPGPNRNTIIIASPNYDQDPLYHITRARIGEHNNIISATAVRDYSRFPTYTLVSGTQSRPGASGDKATQAYDLFAVTAGFRSEMRTILEDVTVSLRWLPGKMATEVRTGWLYRLLVHRDDESRNPDQIQSAAKRLIAEKLKDTLSYTATLRGHIDPTTGAVYTLDTKIQVDDDICDVHEPLWVETRNLKYSSSDGATAELKCLRPESFELD